MNQAIAASARPAPPASWRKTLALHGIDGTTLLVVPAFLLMVALFVYPFIYGLLLSFRPKVGNWLANYQHFFSDPFLYDTLGKTFALAIPVTCLSLLLAIPVAMRVRLMQHQRLLTTLLVLPITLGTVLVAQGMLGYFGPQGWFNRTMMELGLLSSPVKLTHNYTGVLLSLLITGFPFTFLLTLSHVTGIDPALEHAAATLGARPAARFRHIFLPLLLPGLAMTFCLSFVQAFSVFPSAVLVGEPADATRVISIAAYHAAFEEYDYSMASAIAMLMGVAQLAVVVLVLSMRAFVYRGPSAGGKG
ncbi:MAG: ABC transporter permease subunit [Rhodoferax sp.]|nr:ABC transporter permease subunit [Rhodoferax sp.]